MKTFKISNFDIGMPAVLAGAAILTLIICLIVLIPEKKPSDENKMLEDAVARLESRIAELENRLNESMAAQAEQAAQETAPQTPEVLSENEVQIQSITEQLAGIQKKIDYIDKRQGNLEQRVVAIGTVASAKKADKPRREAKSVAPRREAKPAPKKEHASKQAATPKPAVKKQVAAARQPSAPPSKYHLVASGDTRYSIARRYGLTVDQLNRINGFSAETIIHPGQKILVRR